MLVSSSRKKLSFSASGRPDFFNGVTETLRDGNTNTMLSAWAAKIEKLKPFLVPFRFYVAQISMRPFRSASSSIFPVLIYLCFDADSCQ